MLALHLFIFVALALLSCSELISSTSSETTALPTPSTSTTLATPTCVCAFNAELQQNELLCQAPRGSDDALSIVEAVRWNCTYVKIDVSNHDVASIPGNAFESTPHLQIVYLYCDYIRTIDREAFRVLKSLVDVDLTDNSLLTIDADLFADNHALTKVSLSDNPLVDLKEDSPILRSQSITDLDLSFCKLTKLTPEMFSELPNLSKLDLSSNSIQQMSLTALEMMPKLASLDISNNRWVCGCAFRHVLEFSRSLQINEESSISQSTTAYPTVRCFGPQRIMEVWSQKSATKYCPDEEEYENDDSSSSDESDFKRVEAIPRRNEWPSTSETEDATVEIEVVIVEADVSREVVLTVVAVIGAFLCFVSFAALVVRMCLSRRKYNSRASLSLLIDGGKGAAKRPAYRVMSQEENIDEHIYEKIPESTVH